MSVQPFFFFFSSHSSHCMTELSTPQSVVCTTRILLYLCHHQGCLQDGSHVRLTHTLLCLSLEVFYL